MRGVQGTDGVTRLVDHGYRLSGIQYRFGHGFDDGILINGKIAGRLIRIEGIHDRLYLGKQVERQI